MTDGSGAGFEVEYQEVDNQNVYYVTVEDFSQLMLGDSYIIQVRKQVETGELNSLYCCFEIFI